jgi:hypothetical protein
MKYCKHIKSAADFENMKDIEYDLYRCNFVVSRDFLYLDYEKSGAMNTENSKKEVLKEIKTFIEESDKNHKEFVGICTTANRKFDKQIVEFITESYSPDQLVSIERDYVRLNKGNIYCQILLEVNLAEFIKSEGSHISPEDQMLDQMMDTLKRFEDLRAKDPERYDANMTLVKSFKIPNSMMAAVEKFFVTKGFVEKYFSKSNQYWQEVVIYYRESKFKQYYLKRRKENKKNAINK